MNARQRFLFIFGVLALLGLRGGLSADPPDRMSGYAVCGPITINTIVTIYSDYRVVPFNLAPNPSPLEIPEGGYGYAWFVLEGFYNGQWYPVMNATLQAEDAQANVIACETRKLPYEFLETALRFDDAGIFAVKIPASQIGSGVPDATETVTVMRANGLTILPENRRSVDCKVVPYAYTTSWGYRIYSYAGAGATAYVVTATAYAGGGSGTSIFLDLEGTGSDPDWPTMRISRRTDVFIGEEASVGPPKLLDVYEAGVTAEASFPYETSYEFDVDEMDGLEALMAFYLISEPIIKNLNQVGQVTTTFLDWVVDLLIASDGADNLAVSRYADEAGLDIKGCLELSVNCLEDLPLGLDLGAGVGVETHTGASLKFYEGGKIQARLGMSGSWDASLNLGPVSISASSVNAGKFYPQRLNYFNPAWIKGVGYEALGTWQGLDWQDIQLSASIISDNAALNVYDLPGAVQEYGAWVDIDNSVARAALINATALPEQMLNIGQTAVNVVADNGSFSEDLTNFLEAAATQQNTLSPIVLPYGATLQDGSSFNIDLGLEFPIPVFPVIVVKVGGGLEGSDCRSYDLGNGYWAKGYPYLQTEMPDPPQPNVTFSDVLDEIWGHLTSGDIFDQLCDLIVDNTVSSWVKYLPFKARNVAALDGEGSTLALTANSVPAGVDSVYVRAWEWGEAPRGLDVSAEKRQRMADYGRELKQIRQTRSGLQYGIGGFFKFEAGAVQEWNDDPLLTIKYTDAEVAGISEGSLGMYWEDAQGAWHYLASTAVPDSNYVRAYIPYFCVYTLAPRLPQGNIGLSSVPPTLNADGVSTALISSGTLHNNDGTTVPDGAFYTVSASRGTIVTADADPASGGIQIAVSGGSISFTLRSDQIALPIDIDIASVAGYSSGSLALPLSSAAPPSAPTLLSAQGEHRAIELSWQQPADPGIVGYRVYYDLDSGPPYTGTSNVSGSNSPITVGKVDNYILTGLANGQTYHVAVVSLNASGTPSGYSNELLAQPHLQAPQEPLVMPCPTGFLLSWEPVFGATSYQVYRSSDPYAALGSMTCLGQTFNLNWLDAEAPTEDRMFYRVVAVGY